MHKPAQVMFYYSGDGHWCLGDTASGQLQWSLANETQMDGYVPDLPS